MIQRHLLRYWDWVIETTMVTQTANTTGEALGSPIIAGNLWNAEALHGGHLWEIKESQKIKTEH